MQKSYYWVEDEPTQQTCDSSAAAHAPELSLSLPSESSMTTDDDDDDGNV